MPYEVEQYPIKQTQFLWLVKVHYTDAFLRKDIEKKIHQFFGGLLSTALVKVVSYIIEINITGFLAVLPSGRTAFKGTIFTLKGLHLQSQLPIC